VGLKNAFQNLLASWPVPATPSHVSPGVSMKVRMPLMMMSVADRSAGIDPAHGQVQLGSMRFQV
jgi:hypothetical protein